jgi:hypothetical protein
MTAVVTVAMAIPTACSLSSGSISFQYVSSCATLLSALLSALLSFFATPSIALIVASRNRGSSVVVFMGMEMCKAQSDGAARGQELCPAHCITPRNAVHGPTASRYWWASTRESWWR